MQNICDASFWFHPFQCKIYIYICDVFIVVSFISMQNISDASLWFHPFQCEIYVLCFFLVSFISVQDISDVFFGWFHSFQCKNICDISL
jgi:Na+/alanine symporter